MDALDRDRLGGYCVVDLADDSRYAIISEPSREYV